MTKIIFFWSEQNRDRKTSHAPFPKSLYPRTHTHLLNITDKLRILINPRSSSSSSRQIRFGDRAYPEGPQEPYFVNEKTFGQISHWVPFGNFRQIIGTRHRYHHTHTVSPIRLVAAAAATIFWEMTRQPIFRSCEMEGCTIRLMRFPQRRRYNLSLLKMRKLATFQSVCECNRKKRFHDFYELPILGRDETGGQSPIRLFKISDI